MKILVVGPLKTRLCQDLILSLDAANANVFCKNYQLDSNLETIDSRVISIESKPINGVDILLECLPPFLMEYDRRCGLNVGVCDLPTYPPPLNWSNKANLLDFHLNTNYIKVGNKPSQIVTIGVNTDKYTKTYSTIKELEDFKQNRFLFYSIGNHSMKSGFPDIYRTMFTEFKPWEQIGLVLKVKSNRYKEKELIHKIYEDIKLTQALIYKERTIPVMILTEDKYTNEQIHSACDCYIDADHGFDIHFNAIDAAGFGNKVIQHTECNQSYFTNINMADSFTQPVIAANDEKYGELYSGDKKWMEYYFTDLMIQLRKVTKQEKIKSTLDSKFSYANAGKMILKVLSHEQQKKDGRNWVV